MLVRLVAVGTKMPDWVSTGFGIYQKRMPKQCRLELLEIPAKHRGKNADTARILRDEAVAMRNAILSGSVVIALDRKGRSVSTEKVSHLMQGWIDAGQNVTLLVGGPEGIDPALIDESAQVWSLSALTFAHPLVRVMLAEQLYRGWSIIANLPYHRGE